MDEYNTSWLPHLHHEVVSEIESNYIDAYVVALEGWRRGLTLRWHVKDSEKFKEMKTWFVNEPGLLFSLKSDEREHYFFRTRGDKVTNEAVEKGMNKETTKQLLKEENIAVPEGRQFHAEATEDELLAYAKTLGYPVVIKPTDGSFGRGVMAEITTDEEFIHALDYVRDELEEKELIVEKHVFGEDYRLYVVDRDVVGAIKRVPPNIIGDGINSIEALIAIKNDERSLNPRLAQTPIHIDQELVNYIGKKGYSLKTVPEKGEKIFLSDKGNISIGGDPIDVLDELPEQIKQLAVNALRAIPGLTHGAVDLIIDEETKEGYVIELNPTAQIGGILFPLQGKPRDVPKAIIDYYFPETKNIQTDKEKMYFDFYDAIHPVKSKVTISSEISPINYISEESYLYTFSNLDFHLQDLIWIKNKAFEHHIHGQLFLNSPTSFSIVANGIEEQLKQFIFYIKEHFSVDSHYIEKIPWEHPIKIGFRIDNLKEEIEKDLNKLNSQLMELRQKRNTLEGIYYQMIRSISWKITAPFRFILAKIKDKRRTPSNQI